MERPIVSTKFRHTLGFRVREVTSEEIGGSLKSKDDHLRIKSEVIGYGHSVIDPAEFKC